MQWSDHFQGGPIQSSVARNIEFMPFIKELDFVDRSRVGRGGVSKQQGTKKILKEWSPLSCLFCYILNVGFRSQKKRNDVRPKVRLAVDDLPENLEQLEGHIDIDKWSQNRIINLF